MSSDSESDRLRDIADDLRIVHQLTEELAGDFELGFFGSQVCIVGTGIGVIACTVIGLSEVAASGRGIASTTLISTDLVCLACLIWVVRRARSRTRTPGIKNRLLDGWSQVALARLLGITVRLFLPANVRWIKWEEWCAELACIDSPGEKTVYLVELLGKMYRMARVAREGRRRGGL
ncbi:MAG TPA: hypothetical protein VKF14_17260 [Candidatus Dormibacteraeota bacterium]|nr:hypothetical protein [Candidatus Dormibacteraeota bacterium]